VLIGRGVQNYSCADSAADSKPAPIGAVATLFDVSIEICNQTATEADDIISSLPALFLDQCQFTITQNGNPAAGQHYFNAAGSPVFDLSASSNGLLVAAKSGDIPAPADADPGVGGVGNGAVDWLALSAKAGAGSVGLSQAYRVATAGGKAPATCLGQDALVQVQYAGRWFFCSRLGCMAWI
jgi:hypothetical protein